MADDDAAPAGEIAEAVEPQSTAVDAEESDASEEVADSDAAVVGAEPDSGPSHLRLALIAGLVAVIALAGLTGWLGFRAHQSRDAADQRQLFLQVGRQGAINLTTLDYEHIDGDVQRVLDSATGTFYDDFQKRAPSFVDVVKQVKSKSVGTVTEAALGSDTPTEAEVLVAVTVKSEIVGQPEQEPRAWRMRMVVQKVDNDAKVANVEFVP